MHRLPILLLSAATALLPQDAGDGKVDPRQLFAEAERAFVDDNLDEQRRLLEEFIAASTPEELGDQRHRAYTHLVWLARQAGDPGTELRWLLELLREFPARATYATRASGTIRELTEPKIAWVPACVRAQARPELCIHRNTSRPAKYTVYRIPTAQYLACKDHGWSQAVREALTAASILRVEEWTALEERETRSSGMQRFSDWSGGPGIYALREEVAGLTVLHPFEVRTFDVACAEEADSVVVWVTDAWDGTPKAGARVEVHFPKIDRRIEGRTDAAGIFQYELPEAGGDSHILAKLGDEVWVIGGPHARRREETRESLVWISSDRPVYRPGDTVRYQAVRRDLDRGELSLPPREKVRVELRDRAGRLLDSAEREWDAAGSISGDFQLPGEPPWGGCQLVVRVEGGGSEAYHEWVDGKFDRSYWSKSLPVAAFRRPEMELSVDIVGAAVRGGALRARIHAAYFVGAPVAGAEVRWRLLPSDRVLRSEREASYRPSLDETRAWIYERHYEKRGKEDTEAFFTLQVYGFEFDDFQTTDKGTIAEGRGTTGEDGSLDVEVPLPAEGARTFELEAAVRDDSRLAAFARADFVARDPVAVHVTSDRLFYAAGEAMEAQVRVTDAEGRPLAGREVEVAVFEGRLLVAEPYVAFDEPPWVEIQRPFRYLDPWAGYDFGSFCSSTATTDSRGIARLRVPVDRSGLVRVAARSRDGQGRTYVDHTHLRWTRAEGPANTPEEPEDAASEARLELDVVPDHVAYEVGETVRLLVRSNHAPIHVLVTLAGTRSHMARVVRLARRESIVRVVVGEEHVPSAFVHVLAQHQGRGMRFSQEIFVHPRAHSLDVAVSTDRETYGPGEKAMVTVTTRAGGTPVPAEVELSIVGGPPVALAAQDEEGLLSFFLPQRWYVPYLWYHSVQDLWEERRSEADRWERLNPGRYHSGGSPPLEEVLEPEEPRARRELPETLYWNPHLETPADGRAEVEVAMPDSHAEWRVIARAASGAARFGSAEARVRSRPKLDLRLVAPRFLTVKDEAVVAAALESFLDREEKFRVVLAASGAQKAQFDEQGATTEVTVAPGSVQRVEWQVRASAAGSLTLRVTAVGDAASNEVEVSIPVLDTSVKRRVTANGVVRAGRWSAVVEVPTEALPGSASLEVRASGSVAEVVRRALGFLAGYPYGCVEQTASRFLPAVVAVRAMESAGIEPAAPATELQELTRAGLQRVYILQDTSGDWGWWKYGDSDEDMTAYVLFCLAAARQAGVEVDELTWKKGIEDLGKFRVLPETVLVRALAGQPLDAAAHPTPSSLTEQAILVLAGRKDLAPGLTVPDGDDDGPRSVLEAAFILKALHAVDPSDARIPTLVERLIALRRGDAWHSTLDTAWAVYALSDVLRAGADPPAPAWTLRLGAREHRARGGSVVVPGGELPPGPIPLDLDAAGLGEPLFASAVLSFRAEGEALRRSSKGLEVERVFERFEKSEQGGRWVGIESGGEVRTGEALRVFVSVSAARYTRRVVVDSPLPSGAEAVRYSREHGEDEHWREDLARIEFRDDRVLAAIREIGEIGPERVVFSLRPIHPGVYHVLPAHAFAMYDPDRSGWSDVFVLRVSAR